MFQRCMAMLKSPKPMLPFHVVVRHEAYNLEDNEDVNWLCDEIGKTNHGHPLRGLIHMFPGRIDKNFCVGFIYSLSATRLAGITSTI